MKLFSVIIYASLLLPLQLRAMDPITFKRQIHDSSNYYPIYTSQTHSSHIFKPTPKKTPSALTKKDLSTKK